MANLGEKRYNNFSGTLVKVSAPITYNVVGPIRIRWDARKHFYKIIDAWDYGWNSFLGTVPPWILNRIALNAIRRFKNKRFIIHYIQPHAPYLYPKFNAVHLGYVRPNPSKNIFLAGKVNSISPYHMTLYKYLVYTFSKKSYRQASKIISTSQGSSIISILSS